MKTVTLQLTEREYNHLKKYAEDFKRENNQKKVANPIVIIQDQITSVVVPKYHYDTREFQLLLTTPSKSMHHMVHTKSLDEVRFRTRVCLEPYLTVDEIETLLQNIGRHLDMERQEPFETEFQSQQIKESIRVELHVDYLATHTVDEAFFLTEASAKEYLDRHHDRFLNPTIATVPAGMDNYGDFATLQDMLLSMGRQLSDSPTQEEPNTVYLVGEEQHFLLAPSDTENYEERYTVIHTDLATNETSTMPYLKSLDQVRALIETELEAMTAVRPVPTDLIDTYYYDLLRHFDESESSTIEIPIRDNHIIKLTVDVSYVLDAVIPHEIFVTKDDAHVWIERHQAKYQPLRVIPQTVRSDVSETAQEP